MAIEFYGFSLYNYPMKTVIHEFQPIYDSASQILLLGTMPSVKSRESNFYYGHPRNRFWRVAARLCGEEAPAAEDIPGKTQMLLRHHFALWDVLQRCDIEGSQDSTIRNAVPNDLSVILSKAPVKAIFCNGAKAYALYQQFNGEISLPCICLPSTSPANAAWSEERLFEKWKNEIERYWKEG